LDKQITSMDFEIVAMENFHVCGLSVRLSSSQNNNFTIIRNHWQRFNNELRSRRIAGRKNWKKFSITYQKDDGYFYMAAIPETPTQTGFEKLHISKGHFAQFQHTGSMELIKATIYNIYKEIIPNSDIIIDKERKVLHYEYYDHRFRWNSSNSIIDIFVPIESNQ